MQTAARTVGVEEELLLVDLDADRLAPLGELLVAEAATAETVALEHEFKQEQIEIGSEPVSTLGGLVEQLTTLRAEAAAAAGTHASRVVAIATSPWKGRPNATVDARYDSMTREFGLLARQQLTCGQHVHVGIDSRPEGVAVLDRIRPWLSVLTAISANSPFWQGQDTGYASYRSMLWGQWPTAGPTEAFGDEDGYDRAVAELLNSATTLDSGMIYFDARLSAHYPTVEIRVADVCTEVADSVLLAALARALVTTAVSEWHNGVPPAVCRVGLLRAAAWRAARSGLTDDLVDCRDATATPAWTMIDRLVAHTAAALTATGDLDFVRTGLDRLHRNGTGAERQRSVYRSARNLHDVVADAADRTVGAG